MGKFEVRPPMVEAHQVPNPDARTMDWVAVEQWCNGDIRTGKNGLSHIEFVPLGYVSDGVVGKAYPGDWIIRGTSTGMWTCSDEVFKKTYKEVVDG